MERRHARPVARAGLRSHNLRGSLEQVSTFENGKVTQTLNDALAAAIAGEKTAKDALDQAQATADRILKPYR